MRDEKPLCEGVRLVELLVSREWNFAVAFHLANARYHEVDFLVAEIDRAPLLSQAFEVTVVVPCVA